MCNMSCEAYNAAGQQIYKVSRPKDNTKNYIVSLFVCLTQKVFIKTISLHDTVTSDRYRRNINISKECYFTTK